MVQCTAKSNPHVDCGTGVLGSLGLVVPFIKMRTIISIISKVVGALVVRRVQAPYLAHRLGILNANKHPEDLESVEAVRTRLRSRHRIHP
jgi:hypothetical protein